MLWMMIAALCLLASAFLLLPLLAKGKTQKIDRQDLNLSLYTQRLEELEKDVLTEGQYDFIKKELQQNLLGDVDGGGKEDERQEPVQTAARESNLAVYVLALLLPVLAVVFYSDWGLSWGSSTDLAVATDLKEFSRHPEKLPPALDKLAVLLESQPDNHEGWYLLGQSSLAVGNYAQAANAYGYLVKQYKDDHNLAAAYAEALFLAAERKVTTKVAQAVTMALTLNPHDLSMLEIQGMGAYQAGRPKQALEFFRRALATNPEARRATMLNKTIAQIEKALQMSGAIEVEEVEGEEAEGEGIDSEISISVNVQLASELKLPADSTVFVYAKAIEGPGMPLAITRFQVADLPRSVKLTESMAMTPQFSLGTVDKVEIVARISATGMAKSNPEDYQVKSASIDVQTHSAEVKLVIRSRISDLVTK